LKHTFLCLISYYFFDVLGRYNLGFEVDTPKRKWILCGMTEQDRDAWMNVILSHVPSDVRSFSLKKLRMSALSRQRSGIGGIGGIGVGAFHQVCFKNVLFIFLITLLFVQCFYYDVCTLILREKKINILL
jgi:hypothetical protein